MVSCFISPGCPTIHFIQWFLVMKPKLHMQCMLMTRLCKQRIIVAPLVFTLKIDGLNNNHVDTKSENFPLFIWLIFIYFSWAFLYWLERGAWKHHTLQKATTESQIIFEFKVLSVTPLSSPYKFNTRAMKWDQILQQHQLIWDKEESLLEKLY